MAVTLGEIELAIRDLGGDDLLAKLARIDQAGARVGGKTLAIGVSAPNAPAVVQSLQTVSTVSGQAARSTLTLGVNSQVAAAQQSALVNAILALTVATQQSATATAAQTAASTAGTAAQAALNTSVQRSTAANTSLEVAVQQSTTATAAQTAATTQQIAAMQRSGAGMTNAGNAAQVMSPKLRSAANGLSIIAFSALTGDGSIRGMTAAAGLASAALLETFGPASIAIYASGIGAIVVGLGTVIALLHDAAKAAPIAKAALDHIADLDRISAAQEALRGVDGQIAAIQDRIEKRGNLDQFLSFNPLVNLGIENTKQLNELEQLNTKREAILKRLFGPGGLQSQETKALVAAQLDATVQGLAAENRALEAAGQARLATDAAQFALGRKSLDDFFAARLRTIEQARAREVAALATEQSLRSRPVVGETPADADKRKAEAARIAADIQAINARASQDATQTIEQRRQQRESLDKQILGMEVREQEAAGDASRARIAQTKQEGIEIARALVQRGATPSDASARAQVFTDTQTSLIRVKAAQAEAQRVFEVLETTRARIDAEVARGLITQAEGNRQIAAAEQAQIPVLTEILKRARALAVILGNKDLVAQIDKATQSMRGFGATPLGPLQQRIKAVQDALSLAADEGDKMAKAIAKHIDEDIARAGGKITIGIVVEAEALAGLGEQIKDNFARFGVNSASVFSSALSDGFEAALTKGGGGFFKAFGNTMLQGLGQIFVDQGQALLEYGLIMTHLLPALGSIVLSGPASIVAGAALIALGAAFRAAASNNTGKRTGKGGGAGSGTVTQSGPDTFRVVFDPDKQVKIGPNPNGAGGATPRTATTTAPASTTPARVTNVNVQIGTLAALHPTDPVWQRTVGETMDAWVRRTGG